MLRGLATASGSVCRGCFFCGFGGHVPAAHGFCQLFLGGPVVSYGALGAGYSAGLVTPLSASLRGTLGSPGKIRSSIQDANGAFRSSSACVRSRIKEIRQFSGCRAQPRTGEREGGSSVQPDAHTTHALCAKPISNQGHGALGSGHTLCPAPQGAGRAKRPGFCTRKKHWACVPWGNTLRISFKVIRNSRG